MMNVSFNRSWVGSHPMGSARLEADMRWLVDRMGDPDERTQSTLSAQNPSPESGVRHLATQACEAPGIAHSPSVD